LPEAGLLSILVRPGHPDFLDLPWEAPLASWPEATDRSIQLQRGLSRHEVQFVSYGGTSVYALKELPEGLAEKEYGLLLEMQARGLPSVEPVGHALALRSDRQRVSLLLTRYLDASHPYRVLFLNPGLERYRERLLDAMAGLLVRLHLAGAYWGDCSLSNVLFRRDAGQLGAYLVDAETSELHDTLSDGQRRQDLMIMEENVGGDLLDISMATKLPPSLRPAHFGANIRKRYESLWSEVNREVIVGVGERWRIQARVRALNALGFSIQEIKLIATGDQDKLAMRTVVTDRDYHRHRLHDLTGLVAQERQAELMLNEIEELKARLSKEARRETPMSVAAFRWLTESWEPVLGRLGSLVKTEADASERYCQVMEHKWFMSEAAATDVGLGPALEDYLAKFHPGKKKRKG
jgi:DNA-binding transcriptional MerR regulator